MTPPERADLVAFARRAVLLARTRTGSGTSTLAAALTDPAAILEARTATIAAVVAAAAILEAGFRDVDEAMDPTYALLDAVRVAVPAPRARIDALADLAVFPGSTEAAAMCRFLAAAGLGRAACAFRPESYDDAVDVLGQVSAILLAQLDAVGDAGRDASFEAMTRLRQTVYEVLTLRGASLAPLVTVSLAEPRPALLVANDLYRDASRADELVRRADTVHPLFMPTRLLVRGT